MIGTLNKIGEIHKNVEKSNGRGGIYKDSELLTPRVWFSLLDLGAEKIAQYNKLDENIKTQIYMRFDPRVNTDCYLIYEGKQYDFKTVRAIGRNQFLEITATGGEILT